MTHRRTIFPFWCCFGCCAPPQFAFARELLGSSQRQPYRSQWERARAVCMGHFLNPNHVAHCLMQGDGGHEQWASSLARFASEDPGTLGETETTVVKSEL